MRKKALLSVLLAGSLTALPVSGAGLFTALAATQTREIDESDSPVEIHTPEEIRQYYEANPFSITQADTFDEEPDAGNEIAGRLSGESVQNGLNALNFYRYMAGLQEVGYNGEYEEMAQTGATLLVKVGQMTHTPRKPNGVSEDFYRLGYSGTSSSNLGWGYQNIADAVVRGWMDDGDSSNIDRVGHRRWCLNPEMGETGFGHSASYTAMHCFDYSGGERPDFVLWPAQYMPVEYFDGPWNVSLNPEEYSIKASDRSRIKVTMTSKKTGQEYTLSGSDTNKAGKYFNLEIQNYGYGPSVIFEPNVSFSAGDEVTVKITGLKDNDGNNGIQYKVRFFSMNDRSYDQMFDETGESFEIFKDSGQEMKDNVNDSGSSQAQTIEIQQETAYAGAWIEDETGWLLWLPDSIGYAKNQWAYLGGKWYLFDARGYMATGWCIVNGKWYYFGADGAMYASATTPDGYRVNADGEWVQN